MGEFPSSQTPQFPPSRSRTRRQAIPIPAPGASADDVASFPTLRDNLDAGVLLDSTPALGLIDVTSAFQWDFTLFPGETSFSISAGGFGAVGVPEPSRLAMFSFLGVVMTLKRSRKRN